MILWELFLGFLRVGCFAFHVEKQYNALFGAMMGTMMCIMTLADERYMGMQLILLASAGMLLLYTWILVRNLEKLPPKKIDDPAVDEGGFEKL